MSYTYEKKEKNIVEVKINIDIKDWEEALEKSYQENKGKFNIQGFRKGKAPRKVIEKNYGEGVFFDDAFDMAFSKEFFAFLEAEKTIDPIDRPDVKIEKMDEKGLVVLAEVSVLPEIKVETYKNITIEKNKAKVKKEEINAEIEKARNQNARYVEVDSRECANGDIVDIDFAGSVEGKLFDGGSAKNHKLELGSHSFIEGFEEQVVGMKLNDIKTITVKFPENYPAENLAGKDAQFEITLNKIEEKQLPEINDEFASNVSEFENLEDYKKSIEENLTKSLNEKIERDTENALIEKIVEKTSFDVPAVLVERQLDSFIKDMEMRLSYQGIKLEDYVKYSNTTIEDLRASRKANAEATVKTRLVLEEIVKLENLFITPEELNANIVEMAEKYKKPVDEYKKQLGDKYIAYIENNMLMQKLMKFLKENNNII